MATVDEFLKGIPDLSISAVEEEDVQNRHFLLQHVLRRLPQACRTTEGVWMEFGVHSGTTIRYIAAQAGEDKQVFGFDSFEGLPETWRTGYEKGAFDMSGNLPVVPLNVTLIKGWFADTLLPFLEKHTPKISFLHIDCDLYSATKFVLDSVYQYLTPDCTIVFDELVNYDGFDGENGELRAWMEFVASKDITFVWLGMNGTIGCSKYGRHQSVALQLCNR